MQIELKVERSESNPRRYSLMQLLGGSRRGVSCDDAGGSPISELRFNVYRDAFYAAADRFQLVLEAQGHTVSWHPLPDGESRGAATPMTDMFQQGRSFNAQPIKVEQNFADFHGEHRG